MFTLAMPSAQSLPALSASWRAGLHAGYRRAAGSGRARALLACLAVVLCASTLWVLSHARSYLQAPVDDGSAELVPLSVRDRARRLAVPGVGTAAAAAVLPLRLPTLLTAKPLPTLADGKPLPPCDAAADAGGLSLDCWPAPLSGAAPVVRLPIYEATRLRILSFQRSVMRQGSLASAFPLSEQYHPLQNDPSFWKPHALARLGLLVTPAHHFTGTVDALLLPSAYDELYKHAYSLSLWSSKEARRRHSNMSRWAATSAWAAGHGLLGYASPASPAPSQPLVAAAGAQPAYVYSAELLLGTAGWAAACIVNASVHGHPGVAGVSVHDPERVAAALAQQEQHGELAAALAGGEGRAAVGAAIAPREWDKRGRGGLVLPHVLTAFNVIIDPAGHIYSDVAYGPARNPGEAAAEGEAPGDWVGRWSAEDGTWDRASAYRAQAVPQGWGGGGAGSSGGGGGLSPQLAARFRTPPRQHLAWEVYGGREINASSVHYALRPLQCGRSAGRRVEVLFDDDPRWERPTFGAFGPEAPPFVRARTSRAAAAQRALAPRVKGLHPWIHAGFYDPDARGVPTFEEAVVLSSRWGDNPYHLYLEGLTRIAPLLDYLRAHPHVVLHVAGGANVQADGQPSQLLRGALALLGIPPNRLVSGHVRAGIVHVPDGTPCGNPDTLPLWTLRTALRRAVHALTPADVEAAAWLPLAVAHADPATIAAAARRRHTGSAGSASNPAAQPLVGLAAAPAPLPPWLPATAQEAAAWGSLAPRATQEGRSSGAEDDSNAAQADSSPAAWTAAFNAAVETCVAAADPSLATAADAGAEGTEPGGPLPIPPHHVAKLPWLKAATSEAAAAAAAAPRRPARLLLVQRDAAAARHLRNHEALLEALQALPGVQVWVYTPEPSEEDGSASGGGGARALQAAILRRFAAADAVIGPHGAGLTNLITAAPGTTVVEVLAEGGQTNLCYAALAVRLGLDYHAFMAPGSHFRDKEGMVADVDAVVNVVRTALAAKGWQF